VITLTNINCSYDCIYQKNGMCECNNTIGKNLSSETDCIYYEKKQ